MKKSILLVVVLLVILSFSVNAGLFSGVWQDYFTGRQVVEETEAKFSANLLIGNSGAFYLDMGDEVLVEGKLIKLMTVSPDLVSVTVNGVLGHIPKCETKTINRIEIRYEPAGCEVIGPVIPEERIIEIERVYTLNIGDSILFNNKYVTLKNIASSGAVVIDVDGVTEVISSGNTEVVNNIKIENRQTSYNPSSIETSTATLILSVEGQKITPDQFRANLIIGRSGKYYLDMGDEVLVEGKLIKLMTVSPDLVSVTVNGVLGHIPKCETKTINRIEIRYEPAGCEVIGPVIPAEIIPIKEISPEEISPEGVVTPSEPVKIIPTQVCNGCLVGDTCAPFGMRLKGQYCDLTKQFLPQKELKESCENSYECKSNECSNSECISTAGLLQKLLDFLSKLFGK